MQGKRHHCVFGNCVFVRKMQVLLLNMVLDSAENNGHICLYAQAHARAILVILMHYCYTYPLCVCVCVCVCV